MLPAHRPPPGVHCLRFTAEEARDVVALLRAEVVDIRGVALTSRLLTDGYASPLFGEDVERLREELRRIRYLLSVPQRAAATAGEGLAA
jgi:hypothetical protein